MCRGWRHVAADDVAVVVAFVTFTVATLDVLSSTMLKKTRSNQQQFTTKSIQTNHRLFCEKYLRKKR